MKSYVVIGLGRFGSGLARNLCQLGAEVRGALYDLPTPPRGINYVYGLGGRDFRVEDCARVFDELAEVAANGVTGSTYRHIGQREE